MRTAAVKDDERQAEWLTAHDGFGAGAGLKSLGRAADAGRLLPCSSRSLGPAAAVTRVLLLGVLDPRGVAGNVDVGRLRPVDVHADGRVCDDVALHDDVRRVSADVDAAVVQDLVALHDNQVVDRPLEGGAVAVLADLRAMRIRDARLGILIGAQYADAVRLDGLRVWIRVRGVPVPL